MGWRRSGWIAGLAALSTASVAQPAAPTPGTDAAERAGYETMPDTPGTGHYPAVKLVEPSLPDHVVYRPRDLAGLGQRKLGILVWGNGGCRDDGASARQHLAEIASHGYLAIAPGGIGSGPGAAAPPAPPRASEAGPGPAPAKTTTGQVLAGLDWALAENKRRGSPYYRRLDPKAVAVAGHSCGGLQAIMAGADPRIRTVIVHNSGIFADGSNPIRGITVDKSMLLKLHTPVLYVLGGPTDVAWPNGTDDFARIAHVPAVLVSADLGHGGTFRQPNGGRVAQIATDWLDWQLRGDRKAARTFLGKDCTLCTAPDWKIERKGFD
jgi:dienelactone hydrolase